MSLSKREADALGYFDPPASDALDHLAYSDWCAQVAGPDYELPDICKICLVRDSDPATSLCTTCMANEDGALERDTVNPYEQ